MIISHRLYAFQFTNDDFPLNYKPNDVFYSPNSFYKVFLTALKNSKLKSIVQGLFKLHSLYILFVNNSPLKL